MNRPGLGDLVGGAGHAGPVLGCEPPAAHAGHVDHGGRAEHPLDQLLAAHLQREHRNGPLFVQRDMLGHTQRERRLAHAGAGRDDDEVGGAQPPGEAVEVDEPRRQAGDLGPCVAGRGQALEALENQLL